LPEHIYDSPEISGNSSNIPKRPETGEVTGIFRIKEYLKEIEVILLFHPLFD
jgi:hypothetical protein